MKVLVACEESQIVTFELRWLGHEAYSCDILNPSAKIFDWHIKGDAIPLLNGNCSFKTMDGAVHKINGCWDMIIAFPPCTFLTNAGARHLYKNHELNVERYKKGLEAKEFFMKFYNADCKRIAIENPVPSKIYNLPERSQIIQPYMFGHEFSKKTCLWLKGLPLLVPTNLVECKKTWCPSGSYKKNHDEKYRGVFTKDRALNRSKTFPGIAFAMATQWAGEA